MVPPTLVATHLLQLRATTHRQAGAPSPTLPKRGEGPYSPEKPRKGQRYTFLADMPSDEVEGISFGKGKTWGLSHSSGSGKARTVRP